MHCATATPRPAWRPFVLAAVTPWPSVWSVSDMTTSVLPRERATLHTAAGVIGFAVALAAASQVAIPLPGTPVPITLTPLVVVLAGLWLGPLAGAASMTLYLLAELGR